MKLNNARRYSALHCSWQTAPVILFTIVLAQPTHNTTSSLWGEKPVRSKAPFHLYLRESTGGRRDSSQKTAADASIESPRRSFNTPLIEKLGLFESQCVKFSRSRLI